jgi:tRNA (guanine-N7-)-methyltransferase
MTQPVRTAGALHGRRKAKSLSQHQQAIHDRLLPQLRIETGFPPPVPLPGLFPHLPERVFIEIGFGGGEHLIKRAAEAPADGFIGIEPFVNGMAKLLVEVEKRKLTNIRLYDADAAILLDWLPPASIAGIDLLYPDPWPKRRHWKRRFVNPDNLDRFARVMVCGGQFRFASDIEHYVNWTLRHCHDHPAFAWTVRQADDRRIPWQGWIRTRYEAKAIREGRMPAYLEFARC